MPAPVKGSALPPEAEKLFDVPCPGELSMSQIGLGIASSSEAMTVGLQKRCKIAIFQLTIFFKILFYETYNFCLFHL